MSHNRFGAIASDVIALYPQTVAGDFGGEAVILAALDRATDALLGWLTEEVYQAITNPERLYLVTRATEGQDTTPAPFLPISGEVYVWTGSPAEFQAQPRTDADIYDSSEGLLPLASTEYTVETDGTLTLAEALSADDLVCISFVAATEDAAYSVPSLARLAARGAAAELGAALYTESTQSWPLVEAYRQEYQDALSALKSGDLIPPEVRKAVWWQEVKRSQSGKAGSFNLFRGA